MSQINGFTTSNIMEVEATTKAARVTLRPEDYGALGIYGLGASNGTTVMSANLTANSPIFSAQWTQATNLCLVKRVLLSVGGGSVAFAAGAAQFHLFVARSFSAADTGGTSVKPSGNQNKLRTSGMGSTLFNDMRISATGTLTAGTRTLDANPVGSLVQGVPATAGVQLLAPWPLFEAYPGEHPIVLAQNEGLVLQANVPATGTWFFGVRMDWSELAAY